MLLLVSIGILWLQRVSGNGHNEAGGGRASGRACACIELGLIVLDEQTRLLLLHFLSYTQSGLFVQQGFALRSRPQVFLRTCNSPIGTCPLNRLPGTTDIRSADGWYRCEKNTAGFITDRPSGGSRIRGTRSWSSRTRGGRHSRSPVLDASRQARWVTSLPIDEPERPRGGPRTSLTSGCAAPGRTGGSVRRRSPKPVRW